MKKIATEIKETWLEPIFRSEANADSDDTVAKLMEEFVQFILHAHCHVPKHCGTSLKKRVMSTSEMTAAGPEGQCTHELKQRPLAWFNQLAIFYDCVELRSTTLAKAGHEHFSTKSTFSSPKKLPSALLSKQRPVSLSAWLFRLHGSERFSHLTNWQKTIPPDNLFGVCECSFV